jgi:hypothetical protein
MILFAVLVLARFAIAVVYNEVMYSDMNPLEVEDVLTSTCFFLAVALA